MGSHKATVLTVRDIIPQSRLALYGDYEYSPEEIPRVLFDTKLREILKWKGLLLEQSDVNFKDLQQIDSCLKECFESYLPGESPHSEPWQWSLVNTLTSKMLNPLRTGFDIPTCRWEDSPPRVTIKETFKDRMRK